MRCPYGLEETFCPNDCHRCRLGYGYYGDTKKHLIRKVAQVIYRNVPKETYTPKYIKQKEKILEIATKIVEFLGVE